MEQKWRDANNWKNRGCKFWKISQSGKMLWAPNILDSQKIEVVLSEIKYIEDQIGRTNRAIKSSSSADPIYEIYCDLLNNQEIFRAVLKKEAEDLLLKTPQ